MFRKTAFHKLYLIAAILSVISAVAILAAKDSLPPVIPLYFGRPTGAGQLADVWYFLIIPGASILINFINIMVSGIIQDEFIKKVLAISTLTISIMATVTVIKIILLVGFF